MAGYAGVKIPEEIIIVEKYSESKLKQGYVVEKGNKKMLESAKDWAKSYKYHYDEAGKYTGNFDVVEGIEHSYKNGNFKIALFDSANGSSQGGKLSFWNCIITCPDNREFLIGINSDLLVEFLLNNTIVNGVCDADIYLGRISGNVGPFTKNMPSYQQFLKDEELRAECKKTTSKYVPGDIVKTLTSEQVYLGEIKKRFEYDINKSDHNIYYGWRDTHYTFTLFEDPQILYVFKDVNSNFLDLLETKPKRTIAGHVDIIPNINEAINKYFSSDCNELQRISCTFAGTLDELKTYLTNSPSVNKENVYGNKPSISFEYKLYK